MSRRRSRKVPNSLRIVSTKSTIFQKLKIPKQLKIDFAFASEHCASSGTKKNWHVFVFFFLKILSISSHISKTNYYINHKIVFSQVSEHCATFWNKNPMWSLLRGGTGVGLHVFNWDRARLVHNQKENSLYNQTIINLKGITNPFLMNSTPFLTKHQRKNVNLQRCR